MFPVVLLCLFRIVCSIRKDSEDCGNCLCRSLLSFIGSGVGATVAMGEEITGARSLDMLLVNPREPSCVFSLTHGSQVTAKGVQGRVLRWNLGGYLFPDRLYWLLQGQQGHRIGEGWEGSREGPDIGIYGTHGGT